MALLGETEVPQAGTQAAGIVTNENILWLDVPVNDRGIVAMGYVESLAHLLDYFYGNINGHELISVAAPKILQASPGNVLHCEITAGPFLGFDHVSFENLNHISVFHSRKHEGFSKGKPCFLHRPMQLKNLQRLSSKKAMVHPVDFRKRTISEEALDHATTAYRVSFI